MGASEADSRVLRAAPWIRDGTLELLYIKRAVHVGDRWSGQVAFPGGKQEAGESDQQTAEREVVEEIGLHLNDSYVHARVWCSLTRSLALSRSRSRVRDR